MEGWKKYLNKNIVVFYDDGRQVSKKIGILTSFTTNFLFLKLSDNEIAIPIERIIRMERMRKNDNS